MLEVLQIISIIVSIATGAFALIISICKPLRQRWLGIKNEQTTKKKEDSERNNTDKCLLRDRIIATYYKNLKESELKQYEYENVALLYAQYKKLGGNSFVDKIWKEMKEWKISHKQ